MSVTDLPVLDVLRAKMKWHQARQRVLAENVANADTPGFNARELKPLEFQSMVKASGAAGTDMHVTNVRHISETQSSAEGTEHRREDDSDFDTTPSGNSVVLEEQMMKVAQNQMDYQAATTLYSKSIGLLRMALGQNQG
jgi:flagellar basal-body rod protein FlgB